MQEKIINTKITGVYIGCKNSGTVATRMNVTNFDLISLKKCLMDKMQINYFMYSAFIMCSNAVLDGITRILFAVSIDVFCNKM